MRDGTSTATRDAPTGMAQPVEARVLTELDALRTQVAVLQRLVLERESVPLVEFTRTTRAESAANAATPPLFASFFGSFALYRGRQRLSIGSSRMLSELGTYLIAHAGKAIARDALMDLLWPEVDPARATHRLHVVVSDLRRLVDAPGDPSVVRLQEDSYHISSSSVATDFEIFDKHYQRGRRAALQRDHDAAAAAFEAALQVYTGEFLADYPYLDWAAQKRAYYAERHLGALTGLCEHAAVRRDYAAVEEYARAILAVDNLAEQAHRHLMRAHYHLGRRASAIRQYETCAKYLEHELGAAPSLLTQQLHEAIRHDHPLPGESGPYD
jgi:DNA-binding SARP family transcriptional activator